MKRFLFMLALLAVTSARPAAATDLDPEAVRATLSRMTDPVAAGRLWLGVASGRFRDREAFEAAAAEVRERTVLVGHPFGAEAGQAGTEVRSLVLPVGGALRDAGARLDVGGRPERIAFVPSGRVALVLCERGELVSVRVDSPRDLAVADRLQMPVPGGCDLFFEPGTNRAWLVLGTVDETGGIFAVDVAEDGKLALGDARLPIRQASSLALLPGEPRRAVLLGGQVDYEPFDARELRMLERADGGWRETGAFDLFRDGVDTLGIAASGDGRTVLVPNGAVYSEEGGQCLVLGVSGDELYESQRLTDLPDLRAARFAPDGRTALLSQFEPGIVTVLDCADGAARVTGRLKVPLAALSAMTEAGSDAGRFLYPSVEPSGGPQIVVVEVTAPGEAKVAQKLPLGSGYINIPGAIGLAP